MYSSNDFERLFIRYKSESVSRSESMQSFCDREKVPYNLFLKWYKDTRHKLIPVRVTNAPEEDTPGSQTETPSSTDRPGEKRILADIRISNGVHIRQGGLNYDGLKRLVENPEVLC